MNKAQPVGAFPGQGDVRGVAGAAVEEHVFQRGQIIGSQGFVAAQPLQREVIGVGFGL